MQLFIGHRCVIGNGRMPAMRIIPSFNMGEDSPPRSLHSNGITYVNLISYISYLPSATLFTSPVKNIEAGRYLPRMVAITPCASSSFSVYLAGMRVSFHLPAV